MTLERSLTEQAARSPDGRAVYADWLLERADPRGPLLVGARALADATTAQTRAAARLEMVAALKRLAGWLDAQVPEGAPWRPSDTRGVTSEAVGFLSHHDGLLTRLRVPAGRPGAVPHSLRRALPSVTTLQLPAAPAGLSSRLPARLVDVLDAASAAAFDCFDVELPVALLPMSEPTPGEPGWRFAGFEALLAARSTSASLRLGDGALTLASLAALSALPRVSPLWLDRARVLSAEAAGLVSDDVAARAGQVTHLRMTETPLDLTAVKALEASSALAAVERLELKESALPIATLETLARAAPRLKHLSVLRTPLGVDGARQLITSGLLARLETLDVSGCQLKAGGVKALLEHAGPSLSRLVLRFSQLTERDVAELSMVPVWPRCDVRFEEVTFGAQAHAALAQVAAAHRLRIEVNGCVLGLVPGPHPV